MNSTKVGYLGIPGAYSHEAALVFNSSRGVTPLLMAYDTFEQIFKAVDEQTCHSAIVPLENSLAGSVLENYDFLEQYQVTIIGELYLKVEHFLLSPGDTLDKVRTVISHPQALAQCSKFIARHNLQPLLESNTAIAAKKVSEALDPTTAAIASGSCQALYGLNILATSIENNPENYTRFICISHESNRLETGQKCSLILKGSHRPGSLSEILQIIAAFGGNLTKIESRPIPGHPFTYLFYIDLILGDHAQALLEAVSKSAPFTKVLGRYAPQNL